jgi:hypothetical protein
LTWNNLNARWSSAEKLTVLLKKFHRNSKRKTASGQELRICKNIYKDIFIDFRFNKFEPLTEGCLCEHKSISMRTNFYVVLRLRTINGFESYGSFNLGNDREFAYGLFHQMKGREFLNETDVLHMDLMETKDGLPVNLLVISCTAEELAANVKCITREMFKLLNLESH